MGVKIATQVYLFRREADKDLFSVLDAISGAGYSGVEFAGLFQFSPSDIRSHLGGLGLKAVSGHVSIDMLENDLQRTIELYQCLGCEFIVLGWLDEAHRHNGPLFAEMLPRLEDIAAACRDAGLPLAYHNHNFEFKNVQDKNGLEKLLDGVPALQAQLDTGWLGIAGQDPVALLRKYAGRYKSVHLKDYLGSDGEANHDFCPIGMGVQDDAAIIKVAVEGGAKWLIADQDDDARRPAIEAANLSAAYLRSLGYGCA